MTKEVLKLALEALEDLGMKHYESTGEVLYKETFTAIKEALAQPEQEPVAYDKTELNCFAQDLYDQKMREGKRGHYESMFHVIHQCIKKVPPQRTWVGLTEKDICEAAVKSQEGISPHDDTWRFAIAIEAKLKEKNA